MPEVERQPRLLLRFELTVDGHQLGLFDDLSLISAVEPIEHTEGGPDPRLGRQAGAARAPIVVLKRSLGTATELWAWHETVRGGGLDAARRDCALTLFDAQGRPVVRYQLVRAWPSRIEVSAEREGEQESVIEAATLIAEDIRRVSP